MPIDEIWLELLNLRCRLGFQSEPVEYMLTTSGCQVDKFRRFDFRLFALFGKRAFTHTRTCCPSMNKSEVQSRSASGTSRLKLIRQNSSLSRCLFPCIKLLACTSHSSICYDGDCSTIVTSIGLQKDQLISCCRISKSQNLYANSVDKLPVMPL